MFTLLNWIFLHTLWIWINQINQHVHPMSNTKSRPFRVFQDLLRSVWSKCRGRVPPVESLKAHRFAKGKKWVLQRILGSVFWILEPECDSEWWKPWEFFISCLKRNVEQKHVVQENSPHFPSLVMESQTWNHRFQQLESQSPKMEVAPNPFKKDFPF